MIFRYFSLMIVFMLLQGYAMGQAKDKPAITPADFGKFAMASVSSISSDGKYVVHGSYDPRTQQQQTVLQTTNGEWKMDLGKNNCQLMADAKHALIVKDEKTLEILNLATKKSELIGDVYNVANAGEFAVWIGNDKKLYATNLTTKKQYVLDSVTQYLLLDDGKRILIFQKINGSNNISVMNIGNGMPVIISQINDATLSPYSFVFANDGSMAFIATENGKKAVYYSDGKTEVKAILRSSQIIENGLSIEAINYKGFGANGRMLIVNLQATEQNQPPKDMAAFDLWSYTDGTPQAKQQKELKAKPLTAAINIETGKLTMLTLPGEEITSVKGNMALTVKKNGNGIYDEFFWNKKAQSSVSLVNMETGTRILLNDALPAVLTESYTISAGGKYVIYYDADVNNYCSYEIASGIKRNITKGLDGRWTNYRYRDVKMQRYVPIFSYGNPVFENDAWVLLNDQCDIWQVDPAGKKPAMNLTGGTGRKTNTEMRFVFDDGKPVLSNKQTMIVSAVNRSTREEGFYSVELNNPNGLKKLNIDNCRYTGTWEDERFVPERIKKAEKANVYVLRRMTASDAPNYYSTTDFKHFVQLTDVTPQKNVNWLTNELIQWKKPDGTMNQGILYKPENFDSTKKYPIIFHYYERKTEGLHQFITPEESHGEINIPYMVSNGYLVFTPDMVYEQGKPGESALSTVVSAAEYLQQFSWVDAKHMGLQGHSRGGWQTYFVITHSNLFAAAAPGAGWANHVSQYNAVKTLSDGTVRQGSYEMLFQRMGGTLWEKQQGYINNSPIFLADKVTTPVLTFANKKDNDVYWEFGLEFHNAMRRLGKRAWLFQYDGEGHIVFDKAAIDWTMRMKQFFDHYLKGEPAPKWMLYGIPAKMKGVEDGLELVREKDSLGNWVTPGAGLLK